MFSQRRPRILIVGGGFAGLNAARACRRVPGEVVVIDRRNHHLFQPLLYQVATAALSPADIASPIRAILRRQRNVRVVMGTVTAIDVTGRAVVLEDGERLPYDYLVLATGAVDRYFGREDWAKVAPGLKSIEEAVEIRRRFLTAFEQAEREEDPAIRSTLLTTVVIGGGPTGVELAGAMAEMARHSLVRDFRRIDPTTARIVLVEAGDRILPTYAPSLSARAAASLRKRGVEVLTGSPVTELEPGVVQIGSARIESRNIVWAAGVGASPLGGQLGAALDRLGRVVVRPDLSVESCPGVFVIGDLAHFADDEGNPLPGLAPVAIQQGAAVGRNIARLVQGRETKAFRYRDKGTMATIGRGAAIAEIGGLKLSGFVAWLAWIFVHIIFLIGFRNRVAVLLEWAWSYLTWQRGARLITEPAPAPPATRLPPPGGPATAISGAVSSPAGEPVDSPPGT